MKTGDIVLFSGQCFVSRLIKLLTRSEWSHVGMIVIDSKYDFPLIYESTHNNKLIGLDIGRRNKGVQLVPFHERLASYQGKVAIRHLYNVDLSENDIYKLRLLRYEVQGRQFETNIKEMFLSLFKNIKVRENLTTLFCSELIAQAYMELSLLPDNLPSNKYTPVFFSSKNKSRLLRGFLGKEIMIKT